MAITGERIIGIDLGATNSVVAVVEGGQPKVVQNAEDGAVRRIYRRGIRSDKLDRKIKYPLS
jgi:molecular chaperone DnaK (HSP70)